MRRLSPQIEQWLKNYNARIKKLLAQGFKPTPTNAREGLAELTRALVKQRPEIAWVQDDLVPGQGFDVPVRIYHPAPDTALPVLVYYHGGGHMAGSVTVYDPVCRRIANNTRHVVVSVDYRLSPECPYPAGVRDACQAVEKIWSLLAARGLTFLQRLSIAGDSGGGALSATVAHLSQDNPKVDIQRQVLIYPSLDYTLSTDSIGLNGSGYLLEEAKIRWYFDNYFRNLEDRKAASPLFMDVAPGFPETLVITAEFCPLRDEGMAYVRKIKSADIHAELLHFEDMIHAFLNMEDIAASACDGVYAAMNAFLNGYPSPMVQSA